MPKTGTSGKSSPRKREGRSPERHIISDAPGTGKTSGGNPGGFCTLTMGKVSLRGKSFSDVFTKMREILAKKKW